MTSHVPVEIDTTPFCRHPPIIAIVPNQVQRSASVPHMLGSRDLIDSSNVPGPFDWVVGVIGVIGFFFAGWQLWRTANALEAAQQAYEDARFEFAKTQTIREIALLSHHVGLLVAGGHQTDRQDAQNHLVAFVDIGSRLVSLLELSQLAKTPVADLATVLDDAETAQRTVFEAPEPTTNNWEQIGTTISEMQRVSRLLNTWSTTLQHSEPRSAAQPKAVTR